MTDGAVRNEMKLNEAGLKIRMVRATGSVCFVYRPLAALRAVLIQEGSLVNGVVGSGML